MNALLTSFMDRAKESYELKELERLGLTPDLDQRNLILRYMSLVLEHNKVAALIPSVDEDNIFLRHFCDSIQPLLLFGFKKGAAVLDIGAGGGFPSIPIRIFRPDLNFLLVDSNRKKTAFLKEVKTQLALENVEIQSIKAENIILEKKADYVIGRGLGTLQKFSQLAKPLLSPEGHMYTFKTKQFADELNLITVNKDESGIKISEIAQYDLGSQIQGLNLVSLELV
ncbi:MAG: 16S rRNA (guanine(527)-N(7))-methyltransferase RsmG [Chitinispirillales bacterium]|jgi:16S rRNA (guanine527-N7)-methyltransferase|nr:16S rRNA (guanine(527)-N(7))-methyltransferase RsmG [Chitinispirillales bacterium]